MKASLSLVCCLAVAGFCSAQQTVQTYDWASLSRTGVSLPGTVVSTPEGVALMIRHTNDLPLRASLLTIKRPGVSGTLYAVTGEVKYEDVQGDGFLELWNIFPPTKPGWPPGQYFSRTLGESGDMGKITGSCDWRNFALPFDRSGASGPPERLELNVILPGRGTVYLRGLELIDYPPGANLRQWRGGGRAWWTERTAGLIGGLAGTTLGCLAGLLSWLATRGKARNFVLASTRSLIAIGGASLLAALVAISLGQPWEVWFPLMLGGILLFGLLHLRLRQYERAYEEMELRRMSAADTQ